MMKIADSAGNEVIFENYNVSFLNHKYMPSEIENTVFWADKSLKPMHFKAMTRFDSLQVQFKFTNAVFGDISKFSEKLKACRIYFSNSFYEGKFFDCILQNSQIESVSRRFTAVTYNFQSLLYGGEHRVILALGDNSVIVGGAKETDAIIEFESISSSVYDVKSAEIRNMAVTPDEVIAAVYNVKQGEKIVIDGVKKTVTSNGANNFDRVDLINFPRFRAGENQLRFRRSADQGTGTHITARIIYRERW